VKKKRIIKLIEARYFKDIELFVICKQRVQNKLTKTNNRKGHKKKVYCSIVVKLVSFCNPQIPLSLSFAILTVLRA